jgi:GTP1/Obg family GTP-binding protein
VLELANPTEREAAEILDALSDSFDQYSKSISEAENRQAKASLGVEIYKKLEKTKDRFKELKMAQAKTGRESDILEQLQDKISQVGRVILRDLGQED